MSVAPKLKTVEAIFSDMSCDESACDMFISLEPLICNAMLSIGQTVASANTCPLIASIANMMIITDFKRIIPVA